MFRYVDKMEIWESARKHGIKDLDILHAVANPIFIHRNDEGFTMIVGPKRDSQLIEVGIVDAKVIVHAMKARPKFLR